MTPHPLMRFMLGVLIYFPVTFFIWYLSAAWHLAPITMLSQALLNTLTPDALMWLKLDGHNLIVAANFSQATNGSIITPALNGDALGFQINPLVYSYGLPLLVSLLLATPTAHKIKKIAIGLAFILPTELFSMVFSVLKTLTFNVGNTFIAQQSLSQTGVDAIALGYQIGMLLLPMIAPLVIWVGLNRQFMTQLAPQLEYAFKD
jgi:hypothetical protein